MTDFKQAYPKYNPFECSVYWHLRESGLKLALYGLAGTLTANGKNEFYASNVNLAEYFKCFDESTVRKYRNELRRDGWLERLSKFNDRFITHAEWSVNHPGQCCVRNVPSWYGQGHPIVGQIHAIFGSKIRIYPNQVNAILERSTPEAFLEQLRKVKAEADARNAAIRAGKAAQGTQWKGKERIFADAMNHFKPKEK